MKKVKNKPNFKFINTVLEIAHIHGLKVHVFTFTHCRLDNNIKSIDIYTKKFGIVDLNFWAPYNDLDILLTEYYSDSFDPTKYSKEHNRLNNEFKSII